MTNKELVIQRFKDTIEVKEDIMADNTVITTIVTLADEIAATISRGNKLVLCGMVVLRQMHSILQGKL